MKKIKVVAITVALLLGIISLTSCSSQSRDANGSESDEKPSETSNNTETEPQTEPQSEDPSENESGGETEAPTHTGSQESETETSPTPSDGIEQRYFIFRIWNFNIHSLDEFKSIVDRAALDGFNAIKIHIPWHHVETVSGVYDYSPFDPLVDYVVNEKGLKVAISIDFTRTKGDQVLSENDIMRNYDGELCIGGSAPGERMQISLNSQNAVYKANAFYSSVISHYDPIYGDDVLFYLPAFSQYAESEYWCADTYDYSQNAVSAFREFLKENYETVGALNVAFGTNYSSFDEVDPPKHDAVDNLGQLWYVFRHQSLKSFIDSLAETQKWIAPNSKFALQFGSVWDTNSFLRTTLGFVDLCENADVLWVDDGPKTDHQFSMDYLLTALPSHIELAQEIDGPYHSVATPELYLAQGMQCFERGATYMSIANWSINEDYERYSFAWREIASTWLGDETPKVIKPTESSPTIEISLLDLFRNRNIAAIMQQHSLLSPNGEPIRIVITDDLTSYIPTKPISLSIFPNDFSTVQGEGGWYYKSYLGGTFTDMTYDQSANRWQGDSKFTLISPSNVHPDAHDVAVVYKASRSGDIHIKITCRLISESSDGVILRMLYNGEAAELSDGATQLFLSSTAVYTVSMDISVNEGDELAFIINKYQTNTYDTTALSVYIEYE